MARQLTLAWGVHSLQVPDPQNTQQLTDIAADVARSQGFARPGHAVVVLAGMPFGTSGTTNLMQVTMA